MPAISLFNSNDPELNVISDMVEEETCVREVTKNKEAVALEKLVNSISFMQTKISRIDENYQTLRGQLQLLTGDLQTNVDEHSAALQEMKAHTDYLAVRNNILEQRDRDKSVRLFNYEVPQNITATELANKLHEDLFLVYIQAAKDGLLPSRQVVHLDEW